MKSKNNILTLGFIFFISAYFLLAISNNHCLATTSGQKVKTVVIDAGHGGQDAGALGVYSKEKDVALSVALLLGKMIQENFPDVNVHYTRTNDIFIELYKRPQIANKLHADLFISIHCNSSPNPKTAPKGFETFVMGLHKSDANLAVAKKENAAILAEKNYIENYDGFDPNSPEAYIIFTLFQNAYLDQSLNFADKIQNAYKNSKHSVDRGVKQAGFLVLHGCTMPSVLTELGFINNPEEEHFLNSKEGQETLAKDLLTAFREYKYAIEGFNNQATVNNSSNPDAGKVQNPNCPAPIIDKTNADSIPVQSPVYQNGITPIPFANTAAVNDSSSKKNKPEIIFKVQFASSAIDKPLNSVEFAKLDKVDKFCQNGIFKYTSGNETSFEDASQVLQKVQAAGFSDAFLIVFKDGERISTAEAIKILKEKEYK